MAALVNCFIFLGINFLFRKMDLYPILQAVTKIKEVICKNIKEICYLVESSSLKIKIINVIRIKGTVTNSWL
jgi:hypothetical protein